MNASDQSKAGKRAPSRAREHRTSYGSPNEESLPIGEENFVWQLLYVRARRSVLSNWFLGFMALFSLVVGGGLEYIINQHPPLFGIYALGLVLNCLGLVAYPNVFVRWLCKTKKAHDILSLPGTDSLFGPAFVNFFFVGTAAMLGQCMLFWVAASLVSKTGREFLFQHSDGVKVVAFVYFVFASLMWLAYWASLARRWTLVFPLLAILIYPVLVREFGDNSIIGFHVFYAVIMLAVGTRLCYVCHLHFAERLRAKVFP